MSRLACILSLSLSILSSFAFADDLPGSQDLPGIARFPGAEIVGYRDGPERERIYPLGAVQQISNQLRMAGQVSVGGQLTAVTYELPASHTAGQAFTEARQSLQRAGARPLFWCEGQNCGSSSLWANQIFGLSMLYGPDEQQASLLLQLPGSNTLLELYSITRGNRRAYLHVERLQASQPLGDLLPTSATLLMQLKDSGRLDLPALGDPDPAWSALLTGALNLDGNVRVRLVGNAAQAWREALVAKGVRATRLEVAPEQDQHGLTLNLLR